MKHSTRRTRSRIYVIIAILIVGYIIFDKSMEDHRRLGETKAKLIAAKESIKVAPEWKLNTLTGGVFESQSLKGDVALLTFWSSSCNVCCSELPLLKSLDASYKDQGLKIVAISLDDHEDDDLRAFITGEQINYIVLRGETKVTKEFGGIDTVPQYFLIDRNGNVIKYFLGKLDENKIRPLIESTLSLSKGRNS